MRILDSAVAPLFPPIAEQPALYARLICFLFVSLTARNVACVCVRAYASACEFPFGPCRHGRLPVNERVSPPQLTSPPVSSMVTPPCHRKSYLLRSTASACGYGNVCSVGTMERCACVRGAAAATAVVRGKNVRATSPSSSFMTSCLYHCLLSFVSPPPTVCV